MADIARLGFSADTGDLRKAKADLEALVPSAKKVEQAAESAGASASKLAAAAQGAATSATKFGAAASGATSQTNLLGNGVDFLTGKVNRNFVAINNAIASWNKIPASANNATSALNRLGAAANDNINQLQSTPGNVASQFQDIGVTAAAGMNPLLIALQQGTQLSAAMSGGIGTLWAGIKQLLNPMSLLTIAVVALIAYMIQWAMEMFTTADSADTLGESIKSVQSTSYALSDAQSILGNVIDLTTGKINTQTGALITLARAQLAAGRIKAITDQAEARSQLTDIRKGSIQLQGGMGGGLWLARVGDGTEDVVTRFAQGVNTADQALAQLDNRVRNGTITEKAFLRAADAISKFGVAAANQKVFEDAERLLSGDTQGTGYLLQTRTSGGRERSGSSRQQTEAERQIEAYGELVQRAKERVSSLADETAALGMTEAAGRLFLNQQELLRDATSQNIDLDEKRRQTLMDLGKAITNSEINKATTEATRAFEEQTKALQEQAELIGLTGIELLYNSERQRLVNQAVKDSVIDLSNMNDEMREYVGLLGERAMALARAATDNKESQFLADATKAHQERMFVLQREAGELRLTGAALEAYRLESDLLVSAMQQQIELSPETLAAIKQQSIEHATAAEAVRKYREQVEFHRETFKGFFTDMVNGLRQGQTVWEAFGNAVLNVVNKIIDRLLDMGTNSLLDKLIGLGGSLFGAAPRADLVGSVTGAMAENPGIFAKGGAFGSGGQIHAFAKGGAFTNSIYDSPTLFKFAKGGAMGVMGEAGPEAVMPLKRGPDGSLGVQMNGPQTVQVQIGVNDDRFNAYVDDRAGNLDVRNAPVVAEAGSRIATGRMSAQHRRSLTA